MSCSESLCISGIIRLRLVELLVERQSLISTGIRELYRQLKACGGWKGPLPSEFDSGDPCIHSLLTSLGVLSEHGEEYKDLVAATFKLVPKDDEVEPVVDSRLVSALSPGWRISAMPTPNSCGFDSNLFGQPPPLSKPVRENSSPIGNIHPLHEEVINENDCDWLLPTFLQLPELEIQEPELFGLF